MRLPFPNLDDRTFHQLVEEARRRIQQATPEWTDLSPNDPGMVLLELFAYLTEAMIHRLNRLPEKAYIEFLQLIGVRLYPPAAASVVLRFQRNRASNQPTEIPRGTRVTVGRSESGREPPVFVTVRSAVIPPGETEVDTIACHCDLVEAELAATGTGQAGLSAQAQRPPIIAPTGDQLDLMVGVEVTAEEAGGPAPVIQHGDRIYRIWREVDTFANLSADRHVYIVDRMSGVISFAPAARVTQEDGTLTDTPHVLSDAEVVPAGREVRLWYRSGGGPDGNVAANTLTVLRDSIPGVAVTNPGPATGGRAAESLDNALIRGPLELHSLHRAVTARDFEQVALSSSPGVARAKSITRADLWAHATPGTVEVLLVPNIPEEQRPDGNVTTQMLEALQSEIVREQIQSALNERQPLVTTSLVAWARCKVVQAQARIVVRREADKQALRQRVLERLRQTISPLPTRLNPGGWPFGQALRGSDIYGIALAEPGVLWVDQVRLLVEDVPATQVTSITADSFQAGTWYAASGSALFRSLNNGEGWEPARFFPENESPQRVRAHPDHPGLLAVATRLPERAGSRVYISSDCGETWDPALTYTMDFEVEDLAWTMRNQDPVLLLVTDVGLYELTARQGASPIQVLVDPADQDRGFYAVAASRDIRGQVSVAVAAQELGGVFLSNQGGRSNTFRRINLEGEDVRVLAVQYDGPRSFLWAGVASAGEEPGKGCFRWELRGLEDPPEGWRAFSQGWTGGSCRAIDFLGAAIVAASFRGGVLRLSAVERDPRWEVPDVRCGLPLRDPGRFQPVDTVAAVASAGLVMAGGMEGIFRGQEGDTIFRSRSSREFTDRVTLPATWLFCSGEHDIRVESEDEAERD